MNKIHSSSIRRFYLLLIIAAAELGTAAPSSAAALTWNGDGSGAGSGTWNFSSINLVWLNASVPTGWTTGNTATFAGADASAESYVVTVADPALNPQTLTFNNTGYMLTADSAVTLPIASSGNSINVAAGKEATIGSNVGVQFTGSTSVSLGITGTGTLQIGKADGTSTGASVSTNTTATAFASNLNIVGTTLSATTVNVNPGGSFFTSAAGGGSGGSIVIGAAAGITILNVNGGSVATERGVNGTVTTGNIVVGNTANSNATLNINSGTVTIDPTAKTTNNADGGLRFGLNGGTATGTGTVNLDGGALIAPKVFKEGTNIVATFNFNGGTLKANKSAAAYMSLTTANVRNGGAKIDTNGFDITITQALIHSAIPGDNAIDGGLNKSGLGVLTLAGTSTFTGDAFVTAGNLAIAGALNGTNNLSIASGATLELRNNVSLNNAITLTLATGSTLNLNFASGSEFIGHLTLSGLPVSDGFYSIADLTALDNSITFLGTGSLAVGAVPEPQTWGLLLAGACLVFWMRRIRAPSRG